MKATHDPNAKTKFTPSHRKEKSGSLAYEFAALIPQPFLEDGNEMRAVVTLRTYNTSTGRSNTACLWASNDEVHATGSGSAGGGGYHRSSAAAQSAINNAGFTLDENIAGGGYEPIRRAVLAIAHALGYPEARLHVAHA